MKVIALLVIATLSAPALAEPDQWVEVIGGSWLPQMSELAAAEAALKPAVEEASKNRGRLQAWRSYTFQYQGRRTLTRKKYVYFNAFCDRSANHDLKVWVEVMDGGACFFRGKYDPEENRIYDLVVNGVA